MSDKKFTTRGNEPLEARIVAWVLGEASAFEAEELQRLCDEQPELAVFKRRIEAVHGLSSEAHDHSKDLQWKLSPKKRSAIEDLIGAEEAAAEDLARDIRAGQSGRRAMLAIAACLVLTIVVAGLMTPVMLNQVKSDSALASPESAIYSDSEGVDGFFFQESEPSVNYSLEMRKEESKSLGESEQSLLSKDKWVPGRAGKKSAWYDASDAKPADAVPKESVAKPGKGGKVEYRDKSIDISVDPFAPAPEGAPPPASFTANGTISGDSLNFGRQSTGSVAVSESLRGAPAKPSVNLTFADEEALVGGLGGGGGQEGFDAPAAILKPKRAPQSADYTPNDDFFGVDAGGGEKLQNHKGRVRMGRGLSERVPIAKSPGQNYSGEGSAAALDPAMDANDIQFESARRELDRLERKNLELAETETVIDALDVAEGGVRKDLSIVAGNRSGDFAITGKNINSLLNSEGGEQPLEGKDLAGFVPSPGPKKGNQGTWIDDASINALIEGQRKIILLCPDAQVKKHGVTIQFDAVRFIELRGQALRIKSQGIIRSSFESVIKSQLAGIYRDKCC